MAENDELDGITEDEAQQLLAHAVGVEDKDDEDTDPEGAEHLGDPGRRALESIKEQRRQAREERDRIKAELDKVQGELRKHTDRNKSETQRLQEERDALKTELETTRSSVRRREAAEEHAPDHATQAQIRAAAKYIHGTSDEELAASAQEFYALFTPAAPPKAPASKPKERLPLKGGSAPDDDDDGEMDPRKLAALVRRPR